MQSTTATLHAQVPQHEIIKLYNSLAGIYDIWAYLTELKARKRALELAHLKNGETILEVAVGTGVAFAEMVRQNPDGFTTGIDISEGMLAKAEKRMASSKTTNYKLQLGSAFALPAADKSVDILMNNYMFDLLEFEQMDQALTEFKRVLKPGGKLILINMTIGEKTGSGIYHRIYQLSPRLMGGCRGVRLSDKLAEHGFIIKSREYYQQMLFPSEVILAQI
ncbi:MAG: methyltransferase domain-containing protein [Calditrichaeota bacterium]|nr:MAG: methyltransferase domain-containing protein [Calditrichota bacterium]